jgi:hypothetical protein
MRFTAWSDNRATGVLLPVAPLGLVECVLFWWTEQDLHFVTRTASSSTSSQLTGGSLVPDLRYRQPESPGPADDRPPAPRHDQADRG